MVPGTHDWYGTRRWPSRTLQCDLGEGKSVKNLGGVHQESWGLLWFYLDSYGFIWIFMDLLYGFIWIIMDLYGFLLGF